MKTKFDLPRVSLFSLNLFAIAGNTDLWVTNSRFVLATFRRINTAVLIALAAFVGTLVVVLHDNWCCYPTSFSIYQYNLGWCIAPNAAIFSDPDILSSCNAHSYTTWEWVIISLLIVSAVLFVVTYAVSTAYFAQDLRADTMLSLQRIYGACNRIIGKQDTGIILQFLTDVHTEYKKLSPKDAKAYSHRVGTSPITYTRVHVFWFDPVAFIFHTPGFLLRHPDWPAILIRWGCHGAIGLVAMLFFLVSVPIWKVRCCYPSTGRLAGTHLGSCTDAAAAIYHGTSAQTCDIHTWTWDMYLEFVLALLFLLVSACVYLQSYMQMHRAAAESTEAYVLGLYELVAPIYRASKQSTLSSFEWFNKKFKDSHEYIV
jgi:hypothetical protein